MKTFGKQLSEARKQRGITQERLAELLGITRQGISNWERDRSLPDLDAIRQLSNILEHEFTITDGVSKDDPVPEAPPVKPSSMPGKRRSFLPHIISFCCGALLMFVLLQFILPFLSHLNQQPGHVFQRYSPDYVGPESVSWFTKKEAPIPGKPYVVISFSENPIYAEKDPDFDNGYGWNYTIYLTEYNNIDFYPEELVEYMFLDEGHSVENVHGIDALTDWWGEAFISGRGQRCVTAGKPLQKIIGIGVRLSGKDSNGEAMDFYGYMECLQKVK